jgi:hypothetical protein
MLAHSRVQNLSPFLELLLVDFAARKALLENVERSLHKGNAGPNMTRPVSHPRRA